MESVSVITTMFATAIDVDGRSRSPSILNAGVSHLAYHRSPKHFLSFSCWYCRLRNEICTTARSVASFHPKMSVCPASATAVCPSLIASMLCAMASVMKPTSTAKITTPKNIMSQ